MQTKKEALDRRDFLKASTASTAAAFGAFALAGNQSAMAATQSADNGSKMAMASLSEEEIAALPRVRQELVAPPFVPEHEQVASGGPKVVEITMTCIDKPWAVDDTGAEVWAMTYNGSVPGPLVVCHQDDYVELTLKNPLDEHHGAQHRLPRFDRRSGRRSSDSRRARPGDGVAIPGDEGGRIHLSLRPPAAR